MRWRLALVWFAFLMGACGGDTELTCDDGVDDDGDGLVDCADPDCAADPDCPTTTGTTGSGTGTTALDADGDGYLAEAAGGDDCDDADPAVNPGADETCGDATDNDCDGLVDEDDAADATTWYLDADGDGYGNPELVLVSCEAPPGYIAEGGDCDDLQASVHPGADETCGDATDNDCDGLVDEDDAVDPATWYRDADGDGHGDPDVALQACEAPAGYVADASDCDDANPAAFPGNPETCGDAADNDCDGLVDEDDAIDAASWYQDADGDGFGNAGVSSFGCAAPAGYVADGTDCDDRDAAIHPGAPEVCDGADNDCDGLADESDAIDPAAWFLDADGDGFGDSAVAAVACEPPPGYVASCCDCDDADPAAYPGAPEVCADGVDNDCDTNVDEDDAIDAATWYLDADADGYGNPAISTVSCTAPSGHVLDGTDCDDLEPAINPGADESCGDGIDNDCDTDVDEDDAADAGTWFLDADGDGFGDAASPVVACEAPPGYVADATDCDDAEPASWPGNDEVCSDGVDNDCDTLVDERDAVDAIDWYVDADGDGFGDPGTAYASCTAPAGYIEDGSDCDDADPASHPGADEVCGDAADNDCDGLVDEEDAVDAATWYLDADGDGFGDAASPVVACEAPAGYVADATDCDDAEPAAFPGAPEVCGNAIDEDCDGLEPPCGPSGIDPLVNVAVTELVGETSYDYAGYGVAGAGDVDGDGNLDILVGAPNRDSNSTDSGSAYVVPGPPDSGTAYLSDAVIEWIGEGSYDYAGLRVAGAGDVDGDGYGDVLVGAYGDDSNGSYSGAVYLLEGPPPSGTLNLAYADLQLYGESSYDYAGYGLAGVGDVDDDGYDDFLVAAPYRDSPYYEGGTVYLVLGPATSGVTSLSYADLYIYPETSYDYLGLWSGVAAAGDVDGDGFRDLLVGSYHCYTISSWNYYGCAYVILGPPPLGSMYLSSADAKLYGESSSNYAGWALAGAGDVDGDGYDDILVGSYGRDITWTDSGAAYLVLGPPPTGTNSLSVADTIVSGETTSAYAGYAVASAGDVNADGLADILIGAHGDATAGSYTGAAYLLLGPPASGSYDLGDADAKLMGSANYDYAGISLAPAGDMNADGFDDFLVGAMGTDTYGDYTGSAFLVLGGL